jgi:hypothetical protein
MECVLDAGGEAGYTISNIKQREVSRMAIYFNEKFKQLRRVRDLTQEQVAEIFRVTPQSDSVRGDERFIRCFGLLKANSRKLK